MLQRGCDRLGAHDFSTSRAIGGEFVSAAQGSVQRSELVLGVLQNVGAVLCRESQALKGVDSVHRHGTRPRLPQGQSENDTDNENIGQVRFGPPAMLIVCLEAYCLG